MAKNIAFLLLLMAGFAACLYVDGTIRGLRLALENEQSNRRYYAWRLEELQEEFDASKRDCVTGPAESCTPEVIDDQSICVPGRGIWPNY